MDAHKVPSAVQVVLKGTLLLGVYDVVGRYIDDHEKEDGVVDSEIAVSKRSRVFCLVEFYIVRGASCLEGVDRIRDGFLKVGADRWNEFQAEGSAPEGETNDLSYHGDIRWWPRR